MFKYGFSDFYFIYVFIIVFWVIFYQVLSYINKRKSFFTIERLTIIYFALISIAFSFLGLSIGLLVGLSKSPVVGSVIPAILTFFGGFITYAFIYKKKDIEHALILIVILVSISFFLVLGADYTSHIRVKNEDENKQIEFEQKKELERIKYNRKIDSTIDCVQTKYPTKSPNK